MDFVECDLRERLTLAMIAAGHNPHSVLEAVPMLAAMIEGRAVPKPGAPPVSAG